MKHAPSWNKAVEQFHGGVDDVVFGDEMLLKNQVRQVNGVDQPGNGSWPTIRHSNQDTRYGSSAHPKKKISQTRRNELDPRWGTCSSTSKKYGDTSLCNVNKVEKGTVSLDEEQGEVMMSNAQLSSESMQTPRCRQPHPRHAAEGVRRKGGRRVAVMRQEQFGVSSSGAKDLPQGIAEGKFASSDRTRRWTCLLWVQHRYGPRGTWPLQRWTGRSRESQTTATNHDRPTRRRSERADSCRVATWES